MRSNEGIDKPGKCEEDGSYSPKHSVGSKSSEHDSNYSASHSTSKKQSKLLDKENKRKAKEGTSPATTTPSPTQKSEPKNRKYMNNLITIAEHFNSPALPKEICGREVEKERIAEYLSPYISL
jgi:hypothetical protein